MADWGSIRAAIATQCGYVSGITHVSSTNLDSAPVTPAVIVYGVENLTVTGGRGLGFEYREADIGGVLLVSTAAGVGTAMDLADDLLESIFTEFRNGVLLGFPAVVQDAWLAEASADEPEVGHIKYVGHRLRFTVQVRENVTRYATRQ